MAIDKLCQGIITNNSALIGFTLWPKKEVLQIEALSDKEVLLELKEIIDSSKPDNKGEDKDDNEDKDDDEYEDYKEDEEEDEDEDKDEDKEKYNN
ncbi:hypothetical protein V494_06496 [Pseudogymnoascus sp. VKM F-4513 (FW-928)]|nr:hypothetical protein V494_06496 [Pseudogymnoascus sp. VKM F-4513 (FW-928)]